MSRASSSTPHAGSTARAQSVGPLQGEVIPPVIRTVNPDRDQVADADGGSAQVRLRWSTAILAGALVATLSGVGTIEGYRFYRHTLHAAASRPSPTAAALAQLNKDVGDLKVAVASARADDGVRALKKSVDQVKAELENLRTAEAATTAQLAAKLEPKLAATGPALADIGARLDKIDRDPRLADLASRIDRVERQVSSPAPTGTVSPVGKAGTAQSLVPQSSPAPSVAASATKPVRAAVLDNWIVRDVYSGIALVEGRSGSVREVVPGETLPGAGEVRSIQKRGRGWIVVTSRGIIDTETW